MTLKTNLNTDPYFDDFDEKKDFYKVLFKPGVSVQTRELNQLQTILQKQIERFGDNIFKTGSIVEGCHITLHKELPYVKIKDLETDGSPISVSNFNGMHVKNGSNLTAVILTSIEGFESNNPDLNSIYLKYINSGDSKSESTFAADQVLTVFNPSNPINDINVNVGSTGFSNNDLIVVSSAIKVQNTSGGTSFANAFAIGNYITNGLGANVQIVETISDIDGVILRTAPKPADLVSGNSPGWGIAVDNDILNINTGESAKVVKMYGLAASAKIKTNNLGTITDVTVVQTGSGYDKLPYISVMSKTANTVQTATANLTAETFLAKVTVANNLTSSVGNGYGLSIDKGVIYQKGFFQRIDPQLIVVEKYNTSPDLKIVGFITEEEIITSNEDSSLLSNAKGRLNHAAPGADRLRLTPKISSALKEDANANPDFLPIVEFTEGNAFKQNNQTQYNIIEKEIAKRTFEESGDFVVDQFLLTTKSTSSFIQEANNVSIIVDPGVAYINGFRVENKENYVGTIEKAKEVLTVDNRISMNYGNYVRVNQMGGLFDFSKGEIVELHSIAKNFHTNLAGTITTPGAKIGTARIRSVIAENQHLGINRAYLFDINLDSGKNFSDVRSLFFNGTLKAVADVILTSDNKAVLYDNTYSSLAFHTGFDATKQIDNIDYEYRHVDVSRTANTSGFISKTLSGNESFPFLGTLGPQEKDSVLVIPLGGIAAAANNTGSAATSSSSTAVTGTGTSFLTEFYVGDYIRIANTATSMLGKISAISNNTYLSLVSNASITITGNTSTYLPAYVPINLGNSIRTANVSANGTQMTISLGMNIVSTSNVIFVSDVRVANAQPETKLVNRNKFVRINCSSNLDTNVGPWCMGVADIFKMNKVYKGANNTFTPGGAGVVDVTNDFYVDHNQNEDFYDLGYLYKKPTSSLSLSTSDVLLIDFDCFTSSEGMTWINSYPVNDTLPKANSTSTINTLELPEMYGVKDVYYDTRDIIDFRPKAQNTISLTSTAASAPLNPIENTIANRFSTAVKKFPSPNKELSGTFHHYLPRKDRVILTETGNVRTIKGISGESFPIKPDNSLIIDDLTIPAYPSLPLALSNEMMLFADTKVANEKYSNRRQDKYRIKSVVNAENRGKLQNKAYTMRDIGQLERRIETLEYYVSFNFEENTAKNRSIVSSLDSSERFKFGFFVDSFDDARFSDADNPEFRADFVSGRLVPKADKLNIEFEPLDSSAQTGNIITYPYEEFTAASQTAATVENDIISVANNVIAVDTGGTANGGANTSPVTPITPAEIVTRQEVTSQVIENKNTMTNIQGSVFEISEFKMSKSSGPVEIYFNFRDNDNAIEIYQGNVSGFDLAGKTPIATGLSAIALSGGDAQIKAAGLGKLESLNPVVYLGSPSKPAVEDAGKILFTHDPANGEYYQIKVIKFRKSGGANNWKGKFIYRIYYPIDTYDISYTTSLPTSIGYLGTMSATPNQFAFQTLFNSITISDNLAISGEQIFKIEVFGLKPNTIHNFFFNGSVQNDKVRQVAKELGDDLITDSNGYLNFDFFYNDTVVDSDATLINSILGNISGAKTFSVASMDESSTASFLVTVKPAIINTGSTVGSSSVSSGLGRRERLLSDEDLR